jgi:hypothetical protein
MLREVPNVRQIKGESKRRWFSDDYFDREHYRFVKEKSKSDS